MNSLLLKDEEFVKEVTKKIRNLEQDTCDYASKWENFKADIKMTAFERSTALNYGKRRKVLLRGNLETLSALELQSPGLFKEDIKTLKHQLEAIEQEKYHGAIVRARAEKFMRGKDELRQLVIAAAGRGLSVSSDEYRILLPPLPTENSALNTVFLHCDVSGRPYRINDFEDEMERLGVIQDVASIGAYQMNYVWAVSTHSAAAKHRLVAAKELRIKGKKCLVLDPNDGEIRIKIHWLLYQHSDDVVRRALEPFGKVDRIKRET
ncbi:hypothetical protein HPB48_017215 [Haemaphysalis longicornis]|uniref:Uncharacterized protein n=1 Tax=Haemaphysalis longicornis TaxID=44386 RepID=A0A9J6FM52_HAELO|nr:hypothetical protein HPB48_017215 [Haemaphysalis longicornis]